MGKAMIGLCILTAAVTATMIVQQQQTTMLLIVRELIRPGAEAAYDSLETELAALCARGGCPNPYIALESTGSPKQVWWVNAFLSEPHKDAVEAAYRANEPLMNELTRAAQVKKDMVDPPIERLATYRADLSQNARWDMRGVRFVVAATTRGERPLVDGITFAASDGELFTFTPVAGRADGDRLAVHTMGAVVVLAVQPSWSFPDSSWVAADPDFWISEPPRSPE